MEKIKIVLSYIKKNVIVILLVLSLIVSLSLYVSESIESRQLSKLVESSKASQKEIKSLERRLDALTDKVNEEEKVFDLIINEINENDSIYYEDNRDVIINVDTLIRELSNRFKDRFDQR